MVRFSRPRNVENNVDYWLLKIQTYWRAITELHSKANTYKSKTGRTLLTLPEIKTRLNICMNCELFKGDHCSACGCCTGAKDSHFNKLAFPTEECPHPDGPKWGKVT